MRPWRSLLASLSLPGLLLSPLQGAEAPPPPGTLMELQEVKYASVATWNDLFTQKVRADLGDRAGDFAGFGPQAAFRQVVSGFLASLVPSMGLTYSSVDFRGTSRVYSGRLFLPTHTAGAPPVSLPLVIYQHGTETQKGATPYNNGGAETMLGALGAQAAGFAVAMPDGDGMGADPSPNLHAYCQGATTARCLIDMIRAIKGSAGRIFDGINYAWDGRIFIMGYSEGGYIALAAVKELSENPAYRDIKLTGAACMGGPFQFSKATRTLLQEGGGTYSRPYIPAYLLAAWSELYPGDINFREAINPVLLENTPSRPGNPDQGNITQWLDGSLEGDAISPLMRARVAGDKDRQITARAVVNEAWARTHVDVPDSRVNQLIDANDLVGAWSPAVPVLLAHDPFDECVNFFNSQNLFDAWARLGLHPMEIIRLAAGDHGSGHVGGAVLSVPAAFLWFKAGMPRSLMGMAVEALRTQALAAAPPALAEVINRAATLATQDQNVNRAEFPLSRIRCHPGTQGGSWTVTLADKLWSVGKVKLYTLAPFPQFPGQRPVPGHSYYTRFLKQLKVRGDSCAINPEEPCYLAVYPEKGGVALTLGFSGRTEHGLASGLLNIKQVKNKLFGSSGLELAGDGGFLRNCVHRGSFEDPGNPVPFVDLPR